MRDWVGRMEEGREKRLCCKSCGSSNVEDTKASAVCAANQEPAGAKRVRTWLKSQEGNHCKMWKGGCDA